MNNAPEFSINRQQWTRSIQPLIDSFSDKKTNGRIYVRNDGVEQEYLQVITTNRTIPRLHPMAGHPDYDRIIDWV
jgi:hypothetical protein